MFLKALLRVNDHLRLCIGLFLITVLSVCAYAQQANEILTGPALKEQIESQRSVIELATKHQLSKERLGYLWAGLAVMYRRDGDFGQSERAYVRALDLQRDLPAATRNYATTLDNFGALYMVYGRLDDAERYNRMGAKVREKMGYKLDLARSEEHLAEINLAKHRFKQADEEAEWALGVMREEKDPEVLDVIAALNALAYTRCLRGRCGEGLASANESVMLAKQRFGEQSTVTAHSMMALGFASWKGGRVEDAEPAMRLAIDVMQSHAEPADRGLLLALVEYRNYLHAMQRTLDADTVDKQLATARTQMGAVCADCINVRSLLAK
jgi:tetratricopeptide (TPR) repeat protein